MITLDILRGLQGVGAAAQIPASVIYNSRPSDSTIQLPQLGILAHAFPPSRARSLAFATFSAGAPIGGVFGIAIGGVVIQLSESVCHSFSPFYFFYLFQLQADLEIDLLHSIRDHSTDTADNQLSSRAAT